MRVLVTGAESHLGCLLAPELVSRGHDVLGADTGYHAEASLYDEMSSCSVYGVADGILDENPPVNPQAAYAACINLDVKIFCDRGYTRLKQIQHLVKTRQLDSQLFWTTGTAA
jgi:NAD(P)-dependent dehydrogenase (short-subunit alcohol dehydrogenase family)